MTPAETMLVDKSDYEFGRIYLHEWELLLSSDPAVGLTKFSLDGEVLCNVTGANYYASASAGGYVHIGWYSRGDQGSSLPSLLPYAIGEVWDFEISTSPLGPPALLI